MLVYADSSALYAYLHPNDDFSFVVDRAVREKSPDFIYWSFLRFELRHNLRMARGDRPGGRCERRRKPQPGCNGRRI
jgi:hypothetical protein